MNVKIDDLVFDRGNYDADGDVLYLGRGETSWASDAALTPEGHGVRYDDQGEVIGVTFINARRIIERDGSRLPSQRSNLMPAEPTRLETPRPARAPSVNICCCPGACGHAGAGRRRGRAGVGRLSG